MRARAWVLALGGNHDAIAQTRTAQCEGFTTKQDLVTRMDTLLGAGKTEFILQPGAWVCGW